MKPAFENFDPNAPGLKDNNIFGLPPMEKEAEVIVIPVPWEVTVSYRPGTSRGPEQVMEASLQVDLFDADLPGQWKKGIYMLPIDQEIKNKSDYLRSCAELVIDSLSEGFEVENNQQLSSKMDEVNQGGIELKSWLKETAGRYLNQGKKVALLGGDHSTPLGFLHSLAEKHGDFAVLQIDAHADLRRAYEGFQYSHASIMYNILEEIPAVTKLVQVGIRDYCDEEFEAITKSQGRIVTFFDRDLKAGAYQGKTWDQQTDEIIRELPERIYISFDIDGLDPKLCPNTGTPVPGGFELEQVFYLFGKIHKAGKQLIGFDLNEVSCGAQGADSIDPIVGARVLYKLCNYLSASS